jgi:hypothetical protein
MSSAAACCLTPFTCSLSRPESDAYVSLCVTRPGLYQAASALDRALTSLHVATSPAGACAQTALMNCNVAHAARGQVIHSCHANVAGQRALLRQHRACDKTDVGAGAAQQTARVSSHSGKLLRKRPSITHTHQKPGGDAHNIFKVESPLRQQPVHNAKQRPAGPEVLRRPASARRPLSQRQLQWQQGPFLQRHHKEPAAFTADSVRRARRHVPAQSSNVGPPWRTDRATQKLSVQAWLATADRMNSPTHPKHLCNAMRSLASVE